jgi:hypothetical protein
MCGDADWLYHSTVEDLWPDGISGDHTVLSTVQYLLGTVL